MAEIIGQGLSFDDVLLVQQESFLDSRRDKRIDLSTQVALGAPKINFPMVSSNMDTVTEAEMAMAMARYGGLGIIHRFMTPEKQAEEIGVVKREMVTFEREPIFILETATIADARNLLRRINRGYVVVVPAKGKPGEFVGLATNRDFKAGRPDDPISQVMTGIGRLYYVSEGISREEAVEIMKQKRVEKLPVVKEDGTIAGIYTLKDYELWEQYPNASKDSLGRLMVGAAVGVKESDIERAHRLTEAGADVLVVDIAHGGLHLMREMLKRLKVLEGIKTPIIAGNVSTGETTKALVDWGADGVKVGVGPGFVCDTRDVAGTGYPQLSAIMIAFEVISRLQNGVPIMADGGIRKPSDFDKALAAGAKTVMVGSLLAGTTESPGEVVVVGQGLQKMVRGMSSKEANEKRRQIEGDQAEKEKPAAEGSTKFVPLKGPVERLLKNYEGGLRSALTYTGAPNIPEFHEIAKFVRVTAAGAIEQHRPLK